MLPQDFVSYEIPYTYWYITAATHMHSGGTVPECEQALMKGADWAVFASDLLGNVKSDGS